MSDPKAVNFTLRGEDAEAVERLATILRGSRTRAIVDAVGLALELYQSAPAAILGETPAAALDAWCRRGDSA